MQARVIEIYEKTRLRQSGARGEEGLRRPLRRRQRLPHRQPRRLGARRSRWSRPVWPSWRATTTSVAQKTKSPAELPGGRALVPRAAGLVPARSRRRAQNNFLLADLLFEDARFAEAAVEYEKTAYGYPKHRQERRRRLRRAALLRRATEGRPPPAAQTRCAGPASTSALRFAESLPAPTRATARCSPTPPRSSTR